MVRVSERAGNGPLDVRWVSDRERRGRHPVCEFGM